jgi:carbon-monoxide dehydrogenase large subunit
VLAVLTGKDIADAGYKSIPTNLGVKDRFGEPLKKPPRPVLAQGKVRHVGECVACVVAESPHAAQDAAELIAVEYRELPAVTVAEKALQPGAAQLHAELPGNLSFDWVAGDEAATDAAFRSAARVVKLKLENPRMVGNPMEPRACLATYDSASQKYALYACTQGTAGMRGQLVYTMGVPDDKIDVIAEDVGGGFGVRFNMYPEYCAVLLGEQDGKGGEMDGQPLGGVPLRRAGPGCRQRKRARARRLGKISRAALHLCRRPRRLSRADGSVHQHPGRGRLPDRRVRRPGGVRAR